MKIRKLMLFAIGLVPVALALPARGVEVPFTEHVISTTFIRAVSVFATDLDGDGDTDVLSATRFHSKIAWYESDGGSPPTFIERVISTNGGPVSVFATDVDGDGDTDVLSATSGRIIWFESDGGSPPTFIGRVVSASADDATSVFATDVDGDGDTDVLSASRRDDKIAWYESDGGLPPTFTERVITTAANGAASVFATDVDGDGDTDVLSASENDDKIAWYENDGGSPPTFTERVITEDPDGFGGVEGFADGAVSVFATDVDGDGDIDVLSASRLDDKIAWYESDGGSPPSFTERLISTSAISASSVFATDLDGDGDIDVLSASRLDDKIAWYESDGGSPPTFTERVISTAADGARSVFATDVDGDGDIDILSASETDGKIAWYANPSCPATCGDGLVCPVAEQCDDGYADACGSCNADCTGAGAGSTCGDLEVCPEIEECDDGNTENCDGCDSQCVAEECGNGKTQCNEDCDDGNTDGCGLCNADCTGPGIATSAPEAELFSEAGAVNTKNRYVSIKAGDPGRDQAIRVTFAKLPEPFQIWNGMKLFVGEPFQVCENSAQGRVPEPDNPPDFGCYPAGALSQEWFWAAPLVCDKGNAHVMDWHGVCNGGVCTGGLLDGEACTTNDNCVDFVHIYHEGLVPTSFRSLSVYDVQVVDANVLQAEGCYSVRLRVTQARWGDICSDGPGGACTGVADGNLQVIQDVLGLIDKFQNINALQKSRADLVPGEVDLKVTIIGDVLFGLDGTKSFGYPFAPGDPCGPG